MRSASASPSSPNFEALYAPLMGVATRPLTDEMKTTRPLEARRRGSTAWVTATTEPAATT